MYPIDYKYFSRLKQILAAKYYYKKMSQFIYLLLTSRFFFIEKVNQELIPIYTILIFEPLKKIVSYRKFQNYNNN